MSLGAAPDAPDLARRIEKLERINASLMAHVERTMDQQGGAYALFQTAIMLDGQVRARTRELTALMEALERSNAALVAAKEEAETANRSKTRFLAAAGHDLLQPLNAARLSVSALSGLALGQEAQAITGQVERGLQTIEDLIKALLDISKLDAGIVRPAVAPVRLRDLVSGLAASFLPFAARKDLRLVTRVPDLVVASDVVLLYRILQNLVSNAVRYTERGGILVAAQARGDACRIAVIDTGRGIPEHERELVFDEFHRGAASPEDGEVGLGLGLSIVRRMAAALDHPLDLASRVGHGTRVSLTLPVLDGAPDAVSPAAPVTTTLTGARVFVVENDPATAEALRRLLRNWDAEVHAFRSLAEMTASLDGGAAEPHLMIVDYHLDHGLCGLDAVHHMRRVRGRPVPAIVATADYGPAIEGEVQALGCELMLKPIKPAQLRALLAYMLA
ncbi:ATP-binding response regulator [Methylobacterium sp. A54F]